MGGEELEISNFFPIKGNFPFFLSPLPPHRLWQYAMCNKLRPSTSYRILCSVIVWPHENIEVLRLSNCALRALWVLRVLRIGG